MRDLPRIQARLVAQGYESLLLALSDGITEPIELNFASPATAKAVMRLLYGWLWFHREAKERVSMRLNEAIATLYIIPKGVSEKRGRKGIKAL